MKIAVLGYGTIGSGVVEIDEYKCSNDRKTCRTKRLK